jgi:GT2 family glycosyltransferase
LVEPPDWRSAAKNLLPPATRRRDAAERVRRTAKSLAVSAATVREAATSEVRTAPISAKAWLADHHRTNESEQARTRLAGGLRGTTGPPLAVVVDARGARAGSVLATRSSLESQWVSGGRIHVAATAEELSEAVDALAEEEASIPLAVVKAGDTFRPDFAARVLDAFWEQPGLRMVHWDEAAGDHGEGLWVRPSWSPDLLLSANAWGRAFAVRARDWTGFRPESGDAAWWEVLLQSALDPADVRRLARVAMVGTRHEPSPGLGSALVGAELARRGWPARAESMGNAVWLDWDREPLPSVSIVIPTRHNTPLLDRLLPTLVDTDYADFEVVVIDNSGETKAKANWYARWKDRLDLKVLWWEHPFNYSAVNNHAASHSRGEVLVFLNDDTEATSPDWLRQLVGWASRPGIGTVGAQLIDGDGLIQHGGVVVGMDGSAGHLFAGGAPHSNTLLGHTDWTRNVLASTAACVALRREVFDACGGFDERFVLCGSDVNLGLQAHVRGHRNVVLPSVGMRHMESATLGPGGGVPEDQFASWWHYQRWITGGDPFFSPSLSLRSHWPEPKPPAERPAHHVMLESMGRPAEVFRQSALEETATDLALAYPVGNAVVEAVRKGHAAVSGFREVKTVNWVLPPFDNPFY